MLLEHRTAELIEIFYAVDSEVLSLTLISRISDFFSKPHSRAKLINNFIYFKTLDVSQLHNTNHYGHCKTNLKSYHAEKGCKLKYG